MVSFVNNTQGKLCIHTFVNNYSLTAFIITHVWYIDCYCCREIMSTDYFIVTTGQIMA